LPAFCGKGRLRGGGRPFHTPIHELPDVPKTACAWLERTMTTLLDNFPAPDKERAQLLWVAHMNGLKAQVEEVVVREVVYAE